MFSVPKFASNVSVQSYCSSKFETDVYKAPELYQRYPRCYEGTTVKHYDYETSQTYGFCGLDAFLPPRNKSVLSLPCPYYCVL